MAAVAELPPFLPGTQARKNRLSELLVESERLEHRLRDVLHQIQELVSPDDDLACECRRFILDLDR
jgi:hypothetical protein